MSSQEGTRKSTSECSKSSWLHLIGWRRLPLPLAPTAELFTVEIRKYNSIPNIGSAQMSVIGTLYEFQNVSSQLQWEPLDVCSLASDQWSNQTECAHEQVNIRLPFLGRSSRSLAHASFSQNGEGCSDSNFPRETVLEFYNVWCYLQILSALQEAVNMRFNSEGVYFFISAMVSCHGRCLWPNYMTVRKKQKYPFLCLYITASTPAVSIGSHAQNHLIFFLAN